MTESAPSTLTDRKFEEFPLSRKTLQGLKQNKFARMTPIQLACLPVALAGRDILGEARTGSGKTIAFIVPLLEKLVQAKWTRHDGLGALIISPTRELAVQIFKVLEQVGCKHDFSAGCIVGGREYSSEKSGVASACILVSTPGRLVHHIEQTPVFSVENLQMLVLDEADRILDMGFQSEMEQILDALKSSSQTRQTLLFSATLVNSVRQLASLSLKNPELISVSRDEVVPSKLKQFWMKVEIDRKVDSLFGFIRSHSKQKIMVFVSTRKQVRFYYESLNKLKIGGQCSFHQLQGNLSFGKRIGELEEFSAKSDSAVFIATDVAARGMDIPKVDWVVQVDYPENFEDYIHRIGRTARFNNAGNSLIFVMPEEEAKFTQDLEKKKISAALVTPNNKKVFSVAPRLRALLASDQEVKHLAQRATALYISSLIKVRKISIEIESLEKFAQSMGLAQLPEDVAGMLENSKNNAVTQSIENESKKRKMSPLERLKEKIKLKKLEKQKSADVSVESVPDVSTENGWEEMHEDLTAEAKKKASKFERRQKRMDELRNSMVVQNDEDDEPLFETATTHVQSATPTATPIPKYTQAELKALHALKKQRLRVRSDGTFDVRGAGGLGKTTDKITFNSDSE